MTEQREFTILVHLLEVNIDLGEDVEDDFIKAIGAAESWKDIFDVLMVTDPVCTNEYDALFKKLKELYEKDPDGINNDFIKGMLEEMSWWMTKDEHVELSEFLRKILNLPEEDDDEDDDD